MSRARHITHAGNTVWFDTRRNGAKATAQHLEMLSAVEDIPIDDILDEGMRQGEVLERLRVALGEGVVPAEVLERRRAAKEMADVPAVCRICSSFGWDCEGRITRHHFIPRWMMLQLDNYQAYAARSKCTVPICVGRHRDLHLRADTDTPKSIAQFLTEDERKFAQKMLDELREQHPAIFDLLDSGDDSTYEGTLARDYRLGAFRKASAREVPSVQVAAA